MQLSLARTTLLARPARAAGASGQQRRLSCIARAARSEQQQPQRLEAPATLALSALLLAPPALAEEAESAAEAVADAAGSAPLGVTAAGWALVLSPILFYGLFNVYRSFIDPKAKFGDAIFIFAALIILTNIICITVFKIRIY